MTMKHVLMCTLCMMCAAVAMAVEVGDEICLFNQTHYSGWTYSRPNEELNTDYISHNHVRLYCNNGVDYTLTSPQFSCSGIGKLEVSARWVTDGYGDDNFVLMDTWLTIALIDDAGCSCDSVDVYPLPQLEMNPTVTLTVPSHLKTARIRLAAWEATVNSNGAVRRVSAKVLETAAVYPKGDVNGDGEVTSADISIIVNRLAGLDFFDYANREDVNGDGEITASDIAEVVNILADLG